MAESSGNGFPLRRLVGSQFEFLGMILQRVTPQFVELPSAFTSALPEPQDVSTWPLPSHTCHSSPNLAFFLSAACHCFDPSAGFSSPHTLRAFLIAMSLLV